MGWRTFTDYEIGELQAQYPGLSLTGPGIVGGVLDVHAQFGDVALQDQFEVTISSENPHSNHLPALREVGGRTKAIAAKRGLATLQDLHRNGDDTACVCAKQAERQKCPTGYSLLEYVETLAVPYLYGLSYYDTHGKWPWPELSHGAPGLLEAYARGEGMGDREGLDEVLSALRTSTDWRAYREQLRKPSAKRRCMCGSGKRFGRCHRKLWAGLSRMHELMVRAGLDPRRIV